jgi:hypothetical protein
MPYYYTDPKRESEPGALPDVEIFYDYYCRCPHCDAVLHGAVCESCSFCSSNTRFDCPSPDQRAFWYAYGLPGCLWDSDPVGPFGTEAEALEAARGASDE